MSESFHLDQIKALDIKWVPPHKLDSKWSNYELLCHLDRLFVGMPLLKIREVVFDEHTVRYDDKADIHDGICNHRAWNLLLSEIGMLCDGRFDRLSNSIQYDDMTGVFRVIIRKGGAKRCTRS